MSPAHATKGNRRYRYYVSQALIQFKEREAGSVVRVSAREVEASVSAGIGALLTDAKALYESLPSELAMGADERKALLECGKALAFAHGAGTDRNAQGDACAAHLEQG